MGARWNSFLNNAGGIASNLAGGAATGAAVGGPWGALAGLGVGIGSTLLDRYRNRQQNPQQGQMQKGQKNQGMGPNVSQPNYEQIPNYSPQQMQFQNDILSKFGPQFLDGSQDFGAEEALSRRNFQTKTLPGIQEQLTALGADPSHGGWGQTLSDSASNFELGLGAQRQQHALNQRAQNIGLLQEGLRPQYENIYNQQDQKPSLGQQLGQQINSQGSIGDILNLLRSFSERQGQKGQQAPAIQQGSLGYNNYNNQSRVRAAEQQASNNNMRMFNKERLY